MKLLTTAPGANAQGEWELFQEDEKTGEKVELCIRAVPAGLAREIEVRHLGRKRSYHQKKGVQIIDVDLDKGEAVADEKAHWSLTDSRGFEVEVGEDAAFYSTELGSTVKSGDVVKLDGHWSKPMKAHIFEHYPALVAWVNERAAAKVKKGREEDADLGKT